MQSVVVLGGGESGVGAALLAKKKNLSVFVSDYGSISDNYKEELNNNNILFEERGHSFEKLVSADVIVKSPGIPNNSEIIKKLHSEGVLIISEIEFASRYYDGKVVAITGSNGKTTTTSLTYHLLCESNFSVGLGGNIGHAFSRLLISEVSYDWVVLEISSFQLDNVKSFSADLGMILNITPDHLDRYDYIMQAYAEAKWKLAKAIKAEGTLFLNSDDIWSQDMLKIDMVSCEIVNVSFEEPLLSTEDAIDIKKHFQLKGDHNLFNATMAVGVAQRVGLSTMAIEKSLSSFKGIPHRLEFFGVVAGVEFVNDSKATNVEAVSVALGAMDKPVVWIVGGVDKGNDYSLLREIVKTKVKGIVCLTKDDSKIRDAFGSDDIKIVSTQNVMESVGLSMEFASSGDVVLLSPACASFDLFDNYIDRGDQFKKAVREFGKSIKHST